jgi:hypothetical protein
LQPLPAARHLNNSKTELGKPMKAKAAIVSVFALMLAAAAVCGEQYRLRADAAAEDGAAPGTANVITKEVHATN